MWGKHVFGIFKKICGKIKKKTDCMACFPLEVCKIQISKNENVFSEFHSQITCNPKSSSWCFKDCRFQKCTVPSPAPISHSLVVEQFSHPAVGNKQDSQMREWGEGPTTGILGSPLNSCFKGQKDHLKS